MEQLYNVINYFHKDDTINRTTLGIDRVRGGQAFLRWRGSDALALVALFIAYPVVYTLEPFQRQFYVDDLTISHPFAEHERVTAGELFFYASVVPLIVIGAVSLIITKPQHKVYVTYVSILGLLLSVFSASIITDILKNAFGRHRPDFLARCVPKPDTPKGVLVFAKDVCTTDDRALLLDGFRTTPSGHSSISPYSGAWRWAIVAAPTIGASLIALSRTEDYRHHFVDITVGSILGIVVAVWSYLRLFPLIHHEKSFEPRVLIEEDTDHNGYSPV
ncbi:Diacylglycerol pyrophosphate phosphatase 1 [Candidozyma auris]